MPLSAYRRPFSGIRAELDSGRVARETCWAGGEGRPEPDPRAFPHSVFAPCHALVPPQHYYDACMFDSCFVPDSGLECASLQAYATLCAQGNICIDWRNHTHGICCVCLPAPAPAPDLWSRGPDRGLCSAGCRARPEATLGWEGREDRESRPGPRAGKKAGLGGLGAWGYGHPC